MKSPAISTAYLVCRSAGNAGGMCTPYLVCKTRDQADTAAGHIEKWMKALSQILPKVPEPKETLFVPPVRQALARERSTILDVVQWPYNMDRLKQSLPLDENGSLLPGQIQVVEVPVMIQDGEVA